MPKLPPQDNLFRTPSPDIEEPNKDLLTQGKQADLADYSNFS